MREVVDDQNCSRLSGNSMKTPNDCLEDSELPEREGQKDGSKA